MDNSISQDPSKLLVQSIVDYAIYMLDPKGIVTSWNAGAERIKGFTAEEILGKHFSTFYTEEDRAADIPQKALKTARRDGKYEAEGWRLRKGGTRFWASVVIDRIQGEDGELIGFAKVTRDITDQREVQQALLEAERPFRILLQGVTDYAIYMLDPDGRVTNWNTGAERIKGYSPAEVIGEHFSRFYTPEDFNAGVPERALETARETGHYEAEGWRVRKDGTRFWASVVIDAIHDEDGKLIGFGKITRDMTERREAQLRLNENHLRVRDLSARQEAIFHAATDGMIMHDIHGRIESLNPAAARMYGYENDELVGQNVRVLYKQPPTQDDLESFLRDLANHPLGTAPPVEEIESRRRDGSIHTVAVARSPVQLASGLCYLVIARDITERTRVEKMKTEFVSTVSHELRTPLTSIAGALGLLAGGVAGKLPERADELIKIAHSNSERLVRLINDILDIEKIESDNMPFHIEPVTLQPLVKQVIQANTAFAQQHGVNFLLVADDPEGAAANVDADRLMQVLTNLLCNAVKFSPAGSEATVTILPRETRHRITVRDHGSGISDEFRERVFSKFAQADPSDKREKGGTGLGLSIVKEIVDRFGGSVSFESEPGKGTAFHVDLPAAPLLRPPDATLALPKGQ